MPFYSLTILTLSPSSRSPHPNPSPTFALWYPVGMEKKGAHLGSCGCHGDDEGDRRVDALASLAKDSGTEKGSLLLPSSPCHHLLLHRPCLGRTVPHKCLDIRSKYVEDRNGEEMLRRFSSREEGLSLWKVEGMVWKLASSPECTLKSWPCPVLPVGGSLSPTFPICEMRPLPLHPGGMGHL